MTNMQVLSKKNLNIINSFPGYEHIPGPEHKGHGRNMFRGEDVGFGGYVYSKPGMYGRTIVLDVSGMHPASIRALNYFGEYTSRFGEMVDLRTFIKHGNFDKAKKMMGGKIAKYLDDPQMSKDLSFALKIANNSCYGQTFPTYPNVMKHEKNVNNIVALRGALFMVTLRDEVINRGYTPISIKTDSIKIINPDEKIIDFVISFGEKYGYKFETENIFERICLVNDSTFIAKCAEDDPETPGKWLAKADQFQVPYVFKTCFSKEPIIFEDTCETFSVKEGEIYLDMNEDLPDVTEYEKQLKKLEDDYKKGKLSDTTFEPESMRLTNEIEKGHNYIFVGRVGQFCPMEEGAGGGVLYRFKDGKYYAIGGTKGYRWLESEVVKTLGKEDRINKEYYIRLVDEAKETIGQYGDFEMFTNAETFVPMDFMNAPEELPWLTEEEEKALAAKEHP